MRDLPRRPSTRRRLGLVVLALSVTLLSACGDGTSTTFHSVHAGERHTCAIDSDGNAWCWGGNRFGQLGDGSNVGRSRPVRVEGGHSFVALALGSTHTCGVDSEGTAWCWGGNFVGKLGDGTSASSSVPVRVTGLPGKVDAIIATSDRSCAVSGGALWCWGDNTQNAMGIDRRGIFLTATEVLPANVVSHAMSPGRACTVAEKVLCVGIDVDGALPVDGVYGTVIKGLPDEPLVEVAAAQFMFCGRTDAGRVFCWGNLSWFIGQDGSLQEDIWFRPSELAGAHADKLATMEATVCVLEDGRVVCRGRLPGEGWVLSGGVGAPVVDAQKLGEPWVIPFPGNVRDVSGGYAHICAVDENGQVWCSGSNSDGQLGDGGTNDSLEPVRVTTG